MFSISVLIIHEGFILIAMYKNIIPANTKQTEDNENVALVVIIIIFYHDRLKSRIRG